MPRARTTTRSQHPLSSCLKAGVSIAAMSLGLSFATSAAMASKSADLAVDLDSRSLNEALIEVSTKAGVSIAFPTDTISGKPAPRLKGTYAVEDLLNILLEGTGLTWQFADQQTVRVFEAEKVQNTGQASDAGSNESTEIDAPSMQDLDEIVVTGFRSANTSSIAAKRNAVGVLDAISQDTIGLLPDLTISQVARRIPGVTSSSSTGGAGTRSLESAENVIIRGLDPSFNLTTFDGAPIASTSENERAAKLSLFPPSIVSRVEAVKTLTSDLNPHGLSGQLNLVTASAFDRPGPYFGARASGGWNSTAGDVLDEKGPNLRGDFVFTTPFGRSDQWGLVLSGSYEQFSSTTSDRRPGGQSDTYVFFVADPTIDATTTDIGASNGFPAPRRNQLYLFDNSQKRASGTLKLEYVPSEATLASVFAGVFYQDEQETRHEWLAQSRASRPADQTATTGTWGESRVDAGFVYQPEETTTTVVTGRLKHELGELQRIDATASFSRSDVDVIRNMSKFRGGFSLGESYTYDISSGEPALRFLDPDAANDLTVKTDQYVRERFQNIRQDLTYLDASYEYNFDTIHDGFGFEVGGTFTRRDQTFDREYIEGDVFDPDGNLVPFSDFVLEQTFPTLDPRIPFFIIDDASYREAWAAQGKPITVDRTDNSINSDYAIDEKILAVYVQGLYQSDVWNVRAGLRYDRTKADIDLFVRDDALVPGHVFDSDFYVPLSRSNDYDFFLPSLIASYDVREDLVLRAGYGRTIGRPNFSELALGERIGIPEDGAISITRGNPDLKPLVSDNFDLSLEYYFDEGNSLAAVAGFYKEVSDLIYIQTVVVPDFQFEGQTLEATIRQPLNATGSSVYGLEFTLRKDFQATFDNWLSGFIFDGNFTFIGSDFTYLNSAGESRDPGGWENQPEVIANVSLAYEAGRFGTKIAYNYVGEFLSNILSDDGNAFDMYQQPRSEIDLQARFQLRDDITLVGEVQNLTAAPLTFNRRFPSGDLLGTEGQRGRVVWFGLSWTPSL